MPDASAATAVARSIPGVLNWRKKGSVWPCTRPVLIANPNAISVDSATKAVVLLLVSCMFSLLAQRNRHLIHRPMGTYDERQGGPVPGHLCVHRHSHVYLQEAGNRAG